jgi:hypothetical protein
VKRWKKKESAVKAREYHEGPKAGENFEKLARAVFRAPKVAVPKKQPKAKPKRRKTTGSDKG